jgi:hypothetical protein
LERPPAPFVDIFVGCPTTDSRPETTRVSGFGVLHSRKRWPEGWESLVLTNANMNGTAGTAITSELRDRSMP